MSKLIDLKAEMALAHDNIESFRDVKKAFIEVLQEYPNANQEIVLEKLCKNFEISLIDFHFILNIERQNFEDLLSSFKKK